MKRPQLSVRNIYEETHSRTVGAMTWWYLLQAFGPFTGLMILFVSLVEEVGEGETLPVDEAILRWLQELHTPWLDQLVVFLTSLGGVIGIAVLIVLSLGLLLWKRKKRAAAQLGLGMFGAVGLNLILKQIFARDRPALWESIVTETSYSFPSGHAMASSALALSFILIFWQTRYRWVVFSLAVIYMIVIGATRLYLGVHYPSDILGGWMMSAIWITVVAVLIGTLRVRRSQ